METNWAAENLQTIRTLMERSAVYRRALAPIMIFCGIAGVAGGLVGRWLQIHENQFFVLFWIAVAIVGLSGSFLLMRRQALRDSEPFWSPPTRRVAQALLPPFVIGLVVAAVLAIVERGANQFLEAMIVITWAWLFGCAIHSAGFFMPRASAGSAGFL